MIPKPPKIPTPVPPKMPESPVDTTTIGERSDTASRGFKSLISSAPLGQRRQALGAKKSLLGGAA